MLGPDVTGELVADLRALPSRDRRQVLASLSASEQLRITALLSQSPAQHAAPATAPGAPSFGAFSPWVASRLKQAQPGVAPDEAADFTPATRRLLAQIGQEMATDEGDEAMEAETVEGRSLVGVLGGMFSSWRGAR